MGHVTDDGHLQALDPDVVNKIAAGEIIIAPVHALKELVENSVDAGSTSLEILVKEGGLKVLQITDNGCGIQKDDLPLLCERHTTSKISAFEDLTSISTYGFRGEALASISHIAHLTVTTKTAESDVAWRAYYLSGRLAAPKSGQSTDPKAVAGRPGTQITVEDLFYNVPTRRRAFRSPADEYNKIIDMLGRYAVHCLGVGFTCKKAGESSNSLSVQASATVNDRIRQIYGGGVANELIDLDDVSDDRWGFRARCLVTNANYHIKKTTLLLFVNHRSVESTVIKKAVEQTYAGYLPKGGHPFAYISLEVDPARVDVNVHPTKREVHFLNEDEVTQVVCREIEKRLAAVDMSRTFMAQTLLPGASSPAVDTASSSQQQQMDGGDNKTAAPKLSIIGKKPVKNPNSLIRTDTAERKITSMFTSASALVGNSNSNSMPSSSSSSPRRDNNNNDNNNNDEQQPLSAPESIAYETVDDREPVLCRLRSVKELRAEVRSDMHADLTDMFASHTFVGIVDERRRLAAVQGGIKLFLVDYGHACYEYLFQLGLTDFGNFGTIRFNPPLDLVKLLRLAAQAEATAAESRKGGDAGGFDVEGVVGKVAAQLVERREMLQEYFSLEISPLGDLVSIPLLVKGYTPPLAKLPRFLLRLGPQVDWTEEKACFRTLIRELATFYTPEQLPTTCSDSRRRPGAADVAGAADGEVVSQEVRVRRQHVRWAVEHIFFPAFKARLVATTSLMERGVLEVASLKGLYRVFERC
ncbi:DNA mismatch repair protein MLH1 [Geosmithia morbida]|uniref:DNA mismatch repair protein MLH1 n=1 Tax=Geosmithia morbida TaxID=1094350 RepID=A0A9P4Z169_9HYPO|nr:DNA mismatch repair protein MLH1 [Geosmithia morbida]KAF4126690.1 DNA mismatch repair protein MLH1 [Geosmithia morbida]